MVGASAAEASGWSSRNRLRYAWRGRTVGPDSDYTTPSLAADLKDFADKLNLYKFHVVGHSLGSAVVMEFALEHPKRVLTLTVVTPVWVDGRPMEPTDLQRQTELKANRKLFDETMKLLCPSAPDDDYWKRLLDEGHDQQRLEAALGVYPAMEKWRPGDRLRSIPCPKLVIGGEKDILFNAPIVNRAAEALGARCVMMHGVGHGPMIEDTDAFMVYLLSNIKRFTK